jgi:hypothetical protein
VFAHSHFIENPPIDLEEMNPYFSGGGGSITGTQPMCHYMKVQRGLVTGKAFGVVGEDGDEGEETTRG